VGQTSNPLNKRINLHRSTSSREVITGKTTMELEHFHKHDFANTTIDIIDIVPDIKLRLWWENKHISQFKTVYPFGLNSVMYNMTYGPSYIMDVKNPAVYGQCYLRPKNTGPKLRGKGNNPFKIETFKLKFATFVNEGVQDKPINLKWIRNMVFNIKKRFLHQIWCMCLDLFKKPNYCNNRTFMQIVDLIKFRFMVLNLKIDSSQQKIIEYCTFTFTNKIFNSIGLGRILGNSGNLFPINNIKLKASFKYNLPLGRTLFNYNVISRNLTQDDVVSCNCKLHPDFIDKYHKHVVTGDLFLVSDDNLRSFLGLGTGFRLSSANNKVNVINRVISDLDVFIYKCAVKYSMPICAFAEWRASVVEQFEICVGSSEFKKQLDPTFDKRAMLHSIKKLHQDFAVSYLDKVATNYAFTCKFYYLKLLSECYRDDLQYNKVNTGNNVIVNRIRAFYKKLGLDIKNFKFPYLILIPKLHKNPIKFRTITVGCGTYLELANSKLLSILKHIYIKIKYSGCHIVKNSRDVIKSIEGLDNVKLIKSWDFEDLFNSIVIDDLMSILLNAFERYDLQQFISFAKYKVLLQLVLNETYVSDGKSLYRQSRGISMGGKCSSAMADIFLHTFEQGVLFCNELLFFRYVDDVLVIYCEEAIEIDFSFYPHYLNLIETKPNNDGSIDYLDINLNLTNGLISFCLYDKRDAFPFEVNKLINWNSALHISIYRNIIINQLVRYDYLYSNDSARIKKVTGLLGYTLISGYPYHFIRRIICDYYNWSYVEFNNMIGDDAGSAVL
jgi:hypothetical protein